MKRENQTPVSHTPDANHLRGQYVSSVIFFESKTLSTKGFLTEYSREYSQSQIQEHKNIQAS